MQKEESLSHHPGVERLADRVRDIERHLPGMEDLKDRVQDANHRALQFIKERPEVCLIGALAVGFVIGRIVRARD